MSTRKAQPQDNSPLSQERYMSSPEYAELRGVSGTAVAPRAAIVDDPDIRRLLWFLQAKSLEPGGLKQVAREILEQNPGRIGTRSMHKFGMKPGQVYNAEQVRAIRDEGGGDFPLRGEVPAYNARGRSDHFRPADPAEDSEREIAESKRHPTSYPASKFVEECQPDSESLAAFLTDLCVNPRREFRKSGANDKERSAYAQRLENEFPNQKLYIMLAELIGFQDIIGALFEYQRRQEEAVRADFVLTAIGKKVWETLDFALKARGMVLIQGWEGRGKTEAVRAWCRMHRGEARFVSLSGITSKTTVFRSIAKALGIASSYSRTATEMQARIEDVLYRSKLMLVFDEAHFCFNQSPRIYSRPEIIDWIDSALRNKDDTELRKHPVPIALISTPQFLHCVKRAEVQVGWNWRQFRRRFARLVQLPEWNTDADLEAAARKILPGLSRAGIKLALGYAKMSLRTSASNDEKPKPWNSRDISGLGDVATEARIIAEDDGRATIAYEDVEEAIETLKQSDQSFALGMLEAERVLSGKRSQKRFSTPVKPTLTPPSESVLDSADGDGETQNFAAPRPGLVADLDRPEPRHAARELVTA